MLSPYGKACFPGSLTVRHNYGADLLSSCLLYTSKSLWRMQDGKAVYVNDIGDRSEAVAATAGIAALVGTLGWVAYKTWKIKEAKDAVLEEIESNRKYLSLIHI